MGLISLPCKFWNWEGDATLDMAWCHVSTREDFCTLCVRLWMGSKSTWIDVTCTFPDFLRFKGGRFERTKPHLQAFYWWWQIMAITGDGFEGYSFDPWIGSLLIGAISGYQRIVRPNDKKVGCQVPIAWRALGLVTNYVDSNYFLVSGIQPIKYLIKIKNKNKVQIQIQKFYFNTTELLNCDLSNLTVHKHGRIFFSGDLLHSSSLKNKEPRNNILYKDLLHASNCV